MPDPLAGQIQEPNSGPLQSLAESHFLVDNAIIPAAR
jgi:hypothetical protein